MIVKNEEHFLSKTLPNLSSLVDEVIIVDTGSTDNTIEIAKKFNAKVFNFPWINDFSAARNESLKYAKGDFILWIDADEFIKKEEIETLKSKIKNSSELGFLIKVCECYEDQFKTISCNLRPKIFKNNAGIHFERPINEQPYTKDGKLLANMTKPVEFNIYHWGGLLKEEKFIFKKKKYIEMLEYIKQNEKMDSAYYFLLGNNYKEIGLVDEAIKTFDELKMLFPKSRFALEAMIEKASILFKEKKVKEAYSEALEILRIDNENPTASNIVAALYVSLGKYDEAIKILTDVVSYDFKDNAPIIRLRQTKYVANLMLSDAYLKTGKLKEALSCAKKAYDFDPTEEAKKALETSNDHIPRPLGEGECL